MSGQLRKFWQPIKGDTQLTAHCSDFGNCFGGFPQFIGEVFHLVGKARHLFRRTVHNFFDSRHRCLKLDGAFAYCCQSSGGANDLTNAKRDVIKRWFSPL